MFLIYYYIPMKLRELDLMFKALASKQWWLLYKKVDYGSAISIAKFYLSLDSFSNDLNELYKFVKENTITTKGEGWKIIKEEIAQDKQEELTKMLDKEIDEKLLWKLKLNNTSSSDTLYSADELLIFVKNNML